MSDRQASARFMLAVEDASMRWVRAQVRRIPLRSRSGAERASRFDVEIMRDDVVHGRLGGLTAHELDIVSTILEAIDRAQRERAS